jgi:hypothetical protein
MLERGLLALQGGDLFVQRGDEGARCLEIVNGENRRLSHTRTRHEIDRAYNGSRRSRDPFVPPATTRLRQINPAEQQGEISAAELDRSAR